MFGRKWMQDGRIHYHMRRKTGLKKEKFKTLKISHIYYLNQIYDTKYVNSRLLKAGIIAAAKRYKLQVHHSLLLLLIIHIGMVTMEETGTSGGGWLEPRLLPMSPFLYKKSGY